MRLIAGACLSAFTLVAAAAFSSLSTLGKTQAAGFYQIDRDWMFTHWQALVIAGPWVCGGLAVACSLVFMSGKKAHPIQLKRRRLSDIGRKSLT